MRVVTFKIDEDLLIELDKYAKITGRTRSEVIRMAIQEYLRRNYWHSSSKTKPKVIRIYS